MTFDEACLWLNDRLGQHVVVEMVVEDGDLDGVVLSLDGELHHITDASRPDPLRYAGDVCALYTVGGFSLDITDLYLAEFAEEEDDNRLRVRLAAEDVLDNDQLGIRLDIIGHGGRSSGALA